MLRDRKGIILKVIPFLDNGELDVEKLPELITTKTKLISLTHVSNVLGTINPVKKLCAKARALGITTLVDAAQSAGHLPVDVQDLGCDFLALSGHKMCGPTGIGVLYGREALLDAMPPWQGGGDMISSVDFHESRWNTLPHKFEAGTPDISGPIALHAAMDYLDAIGRQRIFEHDQALAQRAVERLSEIPSIRIFGPKQERGGLVSFVLPGVHAHDVITLADHHGIALRGGHHCTQPLMKKLGVPSTARASFYFYNTLDEIDRLIEALRDIQRFFSRGL